MNGKTAAGARLRVVAVLCTAYVLSQFFRSSNAVIAPDLTRELGLSPEVLGALTGAFFLVFSLSQVPVGVALDRFGPRRVISTLLVFAAIGSLAFAGAESAAGLAVGRMLMGLGCASVLMGSLVACARWFPADRLTTLSALILAVGGAGNLLSTTPLAFAAGEIGWRGAFVAMAAATICVALMVFLVVRDAPPGHAFGSRRRETLGAALAGVREAIAVPALRRIIVMAFAANPLLATVVTLWGGPYLHDIHGLDGVARGNVLLAMGSAMIVGTLCYGPLDRLLDSRKGVAVGGALATAAVLGTLAVLAGPPLWLVTALFCLLGFVGPFTVVLVVHARSMFPERLVGRVITLVNFAGFIGVALAQIASGAIIGAFPAEAGVPPEIAYRSVFGVLAGGVVAALVIYLPVPDARPSHGIPGEPGGGS